MREDIGNIITELKTKKNWARLRIQNKKKICCQNYLAKDCKKCTGEAITTVMRNAFKKCFKGSWLLGHF